MQFLIPFLILMTSAHATADELCFVHKTQKGAPVYLKMEVSGGDGWAMYSNASQEKIPIHLVKIHHDQNNGYSEITTKFFHEKINGEITGIYTWQYQNKYLLSMSYKSYKTGKETEFYDNTSSEPGYSEGCSNAFRKTKKSTFKLNEHYK
jgi:hypothetical protein